jgi:high-affinity iron transporter
MKSSLKTYAVIFSIFASFTLFAETPKAGKEQYSPEFIVHLLDYLAGDYGGAVQNGKVISKDEYAEQIEFAETVSLLAHTIPEVSTNTDVVAKISILKQKIENKADAKDVAASAREAQKLLINALNIKVAPTHLPSFENGQKLFANNCISCHGQNGLGDGPNGKGLDPKPANFHNKERMSEISIFHCFNTIRMGVPGTGMVAWHELSDKDVWDLATYVMGLRYKDQNIKEFSSAPKLSLTDLTTLTDDQIKNKIEGSEENKNKALAFLRTYNNKDNDNDGIKKARTLLENAKETYEKGDLKQAEKLAINAYLEGVEPIEPALKANKPELLPVIESAMAEFRKEVKKENNLSVIEEKISDINLVLTEIQEAIQKEEMSFGVAFGGSFAIILREGFEAVLVIITLLSVLKAFSNKKAIIAVHAGWILALGVGVLTWLLSGVLINISGMGQEMMEAVTSVFAVVILLYFGFWLHRQTEIGRWKKFIEEKVQNAVENSNLIAIGSISFMAAYREAFETVLFIRTIWTQSGVAGKNGIGFGLVSAFAIIFIFSILAVKYSKKLPIKNLFKVSAWMMCVLAFILAGKAVHAFQAVGLIGISLLPVKFSVELIGVHSTTQTLLAQIIVGLFSISLLKYSQKKA